MGDSRLKALPDIHEISQLGPGVKAAYSGRRYDEPSAREFVSALGLSPANYFKPKQVHGDEILILEKDSRFSPGMEADGVMTAEPGLVLGIKTADCIPAFFWDPTRKVAGLSHAGWRGLHKGILVKMLRLFKTKFNSKFSDVRIVFGPAVGVCCYETGPEFSSYFPGFFKPKLNGKGMTDLIGAARAQLEKEGALSSHIQSVEICTSCRSADFYSARKGAASERILSVISIQKQG